MFAIHHASVSLLFGALLLLAGCGQEGPLGNTPPQGRPDWMKKENTRPAPASPAEPKGQ